MGALGPLNYYFGQERYIEESISYYYELNLKRINDKDLIEPLSA